MYEKGYDICYKYTIYIFFCQRDSHFVQKNAILCLQKCHKEMSQKTKRRENK